MSKIAIIFPGVGYHTDKPLLYYGKKTAQECGYRIVEVNYGGFDSKNIRGNEEKKRAALEMAVAQTEEILEKECFAPEDEVLCISKSMGTIVAGMWQRKHEIAAKNIYFTPVEETFRFARAQSGIVFHGTGDPWVESSIVTSNCERLLLPLYITEGANHSMECGEVCKDLNEMSRIMEVCSTFLAGGLLTI